MVSKELQVGSLQFKFKGSCLGKRLEILQKRVYLPLCILFTRISATLLMSQIRRTTIVLLTTSIIFPLARTKFLSLKSLKSNRVRVKSYYFIFCRKKKHHIVTSFPGGAFPCTHFRSRIETDNEVNN